VAPYAGIVLQDAYAWVRSHPQAADGRRGDTLAALTPREREVLWLIAQGRSNPAIASALFISPKLVEKHVASIFGKLGLAPSDSDNRRVIAAIRYLES